MMHSSILKGWVGRGALSLALLAGAVAVFLGGVVAWMEGFMRNKRIVLIPLHGPCLR